MEHSAALSFGDGVLMAQVFFRGRPLVFGACVVKLLGEEDRVRFVVLESNRFELVVDAKEGVRLLHARQCPCLVNRRVPDEEIGRQSVLLAACVIVHVRERGFLVTRRALHMRTFPGVYVLPGGHVDAGELPEECARQVLLTFV